MNIVVFNTKPYDKTFLQQHNEPYGHQLTFLKPHLDMETVKLAEGYEAVCAFVNDDLNENVLRALHQGGTKVIAMRCAGYNNVDLAVAKELGMDVVRVPAYSPYAVAEHTIALLLTLNRKTHRAYNRVREGNFSLDGLLGFDLHQKTVGLIGTGKIGRVTAGLFQGFGCTVLAHDPYPHEEMIDRGIQYVPLEQLLKQSDIVSLHCPLTTDTYHLIASEQLAMMKDSAIIINTSRGALLDAKAVIDALKSGKIGGVAIDVYEEEADLFFEDMSGKIIQDDIFARLLTFPNVIITGHQAFFTAEALTNIATTTLQNITEIETTGECINRVFP